jgi:hypothetical protein
MPKKRRKQSGKLKKKQRKKAKGKMPPAVLKYFKLRSSGMSKAKARKEAGLGEKS